MPSSDYQRYESNGQGKRRMKRIILEILVSALLIISGVILFIHWKELMQSQILKKVELKRDSDGYKNWVNPPITSTRSYHLFNITNHIAIVIDPSSSPVNVSDTPPYVYNLKTLKKNIQWSNNDKEISYEVERLFTRHPTEFNSSSINDTGVFVDLLRAIFRIQFETKPAQLFFDVSGVESFYQRNAIEQLEGFTSDLFKIVREKMIGPNTDKSGFIYRQNGSRLYNVSIKTDGAKKGQVIKFASELVPFKINSSEYKFPIYDGLTFPSMLFDKPILNIFNSDFCRPIRVEYVQDVSMFQGLNVRQYKVKLIDYDKCTNTSDENTCPEVEKLDVSKCISDSLPNNTIFLSKAHFYGSKNETNEERNIHGFTPTHDIHESYVYFEPYSGTPCKAVYRMQLNIDAMLDPMRLIGDGTKLKPANLRSVRRLLPIFWVDQTVDLSDTVINRLRLGLWFYHNGQFIIIPVAIGLSIIFIIVIECLAKRSGKNVQYTRSDYLR